MRDAHQRKTTGNINSFQKYIDEDSFFFFFFFLRQLVQLISATEDQILMCVLGIRKILKAYFIKLDKF